MVIKIPSSNKKPPFIIPIFISHQGCPHRCIFCDQVRITGTVREEQQNVSLRAVEERVKEQLAWPRRDPSREVQVAFYGGSFTGLEKSLQKDLLDTVQPFLQSGQVRTIRLSTRPDYVDEQTAVFLKERNVTIVELGVQSMDQVVLDASVRGHTVEHVVQAIDALKQAGISVGAQLMIGLPAESTKNFIAGALRLAKLGPDFVRIYPVLVVKGSGLALLYEQGKYRPLSLYKAIALSAKLKDIFDNCKIPVVRMGLQATDSLPDSILAGPYHPAFGEMVLSRLMYNKMRSLLNTGGSSKQREIVCASADQSIVRGQKNCSIKRLSAKGLLDKVNIVFDPDLKRQTMLLRRAVGGEQP